MPSGGDDHVGSQRLLSERHVVDRRGQHDPYAVVARVGRHVDPALAGIAHQLLDSDMEVNAK